MIQLSDIGKNLFDALVCTLLHGECQEIATSADDVVGTEYRLKGLRMLVNDEESLWKVKGPDWFAIESEGVVELYGIDEDTFTTFTYNFLGEEDFPFVGLTDGD